MASTSYGEQMTWHPETAEVPPGCASSSRGSLSAAALLVAAWIVPGVAIGASADALVAALLIGILNAVLPPIVAALACRSWPCWGS